MASPAARTSQARASTPPGRSPSSVYRMSHRASCSPACQAASPGGQGSPTAQARQGLLRHPTHMGPEVWCAHGQRPASRLLPCTAAQCRACTLHAGRAAGPAEAHLQLSQERCPGAGRLQLLPLHKGGRVEHVEHLRGSQARRRLHAPGHQPLGLACYLPRWLAVPGGLLACSRPVHSCAYAAPASPQAGRLRLQGGLRGARTSCCCAQHLVPSAVEVMLSLCSCIRCSYRPALLLIAAERVPGQPGPMDSRVLSAPLTARAPCTRLAQGRQ